MSPKRQRTAAAWQHAFGDVTTDMALAFAGNGAGFVISGVPIARDSAFLEAGLDFKIAPDATLGISYQGQPATCRITASAAASTGAFRKLIPTVTLVG